METQRNSTELSAKVDQNTALFLAELIIPPSHWIYSRRETSEMVVYTVFWDEKPVGQFGIPYVLADNEYGLIQTVGQADHPELLQIIRRLRSRLAFFYQSIWKDEINERTE